MFGISFLLRSTVSSEVGPKQTQGLVGQLHGCNGATGDAIDTQNRVGQCVR